MSGKSLAFRYKSHQLLVWSLEMVQRCGGYTYEQGELRGRVGKEVRKQMDVPLHCPPLQKHGVMMHDVVNSVLLPSIALNCLPGCCTRMFNCSGILD
jgi:hypothetical protein